MLYVTRGPSRILAMQHTTRETRPRGQPLRPCLRATMQPGVGSCNHPWRAPGILAPHIKTPPFPWWRTPFFLQKIIPECQNLAFCTKSTQGPLRKSLYLSAEHLENIVAPQPDVASHNARTNTTEALSRSVTWKQVSFTESAHGDEGESEEHAEISATLRDFFPLRLAAQAEDCVPRTLPLPSC